MIKQLTSDIMANIVKDKLRQKGYNMATTIKKELKDSTIEPIHNTINNIMATPSTISKELQRQAYHEASNNFNINNYDYWGEYYKSYDKRYSPTPEPNLAELLYIQECNNRKLRGY